MRGPRQLSRTALVLVALSASGALPTATSAATASLDRACYVSGEPGTLSLAGFSPNAVVSLANDDGDRTSVTTDAAGSLVVAIGPPAGDDLPRPGSREIVFTATEDANPANVATAVGRIAPLAFATDTGPKSPAAKRAWYFSGWTPGKAIYAHFRLGGRTRGTYRFGVATGPCGLYQRRAPGIAIKGRVGAGAWTIQVDQAARFSTRTTEKLTTRTAVYTTFRPRATTSAAALSTAALLGSYRFATFASFAGGIQLRA